MKTVKMMKMMTAILCIFDDGDDGDEVYNVDISVYKNESLPLVN